MNQQKLIVCDNHPSLLKSLNLCGIGYGNEEMVQYTTDSKKTINVPVNTGMIYLLHAPPVSNVFDKLRKCKDTHPQVPVVVASVDTSFDEVRKLFKAGADDVLPFPTPSLQLQNCLSSFMDTPSKDINVLNKITYISANNLEAELLGSCSIRLNGENLDLPNKTKQLLGVLISHYPRPIKWDYLATAFWPDKSHNNLKSAKNSLNVEITKIRNEFRKICGQNAGFIIRNENNYQFEQSLTINSDLQHFEKLYNEIYASLNAQEPVSEKQFKTFIDLYNGNFMSNCNLEGHDLLHLERQKYSTLLEGLTENYCKYLRQNNNETLATLFQLEVAGKKHG